MKTNNEILLKLYGDSSVDPLKVGVQINRMDKIKDDPEENYSDEDYFKGVVDDKTAAAFFDDVKSTSSQVEKELDK